MKSQILILKKQSSKADSISLSEAKINLNVTKIGKLRHLNSRGEVRDYNSENGLNFSSYKPQNKKRIKKLTKIIVSKSTNMKQQRKEMQRSISNLKLKEKFSKKSRIKHSKRLALSRHFNKSPSQNSGNKVCYSRKISASACERRYKFRSSTPDCNFGYKSLSRSISKQIVRPNATNPTECATPVLQVPQEVGLNVSEACCKCSKDGKFCSCQIMVSIPLYLLRKLENHPITEAFQVGLELLQERADSNGSKFLHLVQNSIKTLLTAQKSQLSSLKSQLSQLTAHLSSVQDQLESVQQQAAEQSSHLEQLQVKMKRKEEDLIKTTQENIELLSKLEDSADSNKQLKERNKSLNDEFDRMLKKLKHSQLYEKRLMYLIFLAVEEGYPIDKIYEEKVGNLSSKIFEDISNQYDSTSLLDSCFESPLKKKEKEIKLINESSCRSSQLFDSKASYEKIKYDLIPKITKKPSQIAILDLEEIKNDSSYMQKSTTNIDFTDTILGENLLIRFRRCRSHDDIFLSICSNSES
ncbi:unnamed protein product [Moneuplotes crassus]|uniref:Uncharacterized protein n=1 Tax=Euplotes crassus TaxID=5936 RepID=A0AAD1U1C5_EUPCR|nr:unnamed protein product [Moneuplotes crassus]